MDSAPRMWQMWMYGENKKQEAEEQTCGKISGGPGPWQVDYESAVPWKPGEPNVS